MLHDQKTNSLILQCEDPFALREVLPKSKLLDHPDYNIAIHYTHNTTRILRNMGFRVEWPEVATYDWPGKYRPMSQQRSMVDFYLEHRRCFNLSEMGTGKTAASLWASDILIRTGKVRKVLVVCPLSTTERVWMQDIFDVLMHRQCSIVHGGKDKREKAFAMDVDYYILNHDGIVLQDVLKALRSRNDIDLILIDEGSMFRNSSTQKWKALNGCIKNHQRLWWLTGTPCPNEPLDAWAQARIVNPDRVPNRAGKFKRQTMMQVSPFKWVPKKGSDVTAWQAMQPAIRFLKKDCMDLPPLTQRDVQAQLTKAQRMAFKMMQDEMIMFDQHGEPVTAANAADKINKLRQILLGSIKDPVSGEYITIDHAPRLEVTLELMEQANGKVLIIVPFKGILRVLEKEISKHYSVGVLNGDIPTGQRNRIIADFKTLDDPHTLLCHPQVMAHGLNFTEADTLLSYGPINSNDQWRQAIERMNRAGQTRPMSVYRIGAHLLEWEIYKILDNRHLTQTSILKLYELAKAL